jgi:hypothetical protein
MLNSEKMIMKFDRLIHRSVHSSDFASAQIFNYDFLTSVFNQER